MTVLWRNFKLLFIDGVFRPGPQVACPPNQIRVFMCCAMCKRIMPHWHNSMTAAEAKKLGRLGCKCGSLRLQPIIIPGWQSFYWFVIRGWLIRKVILKARIWDPRMVILEKDLE